MLPKRKFVACFTVLLTISAHYAEGCIFSKKKEERQNQSFVQLKNSSCQLQVERSMKTKARHVANGLIFGNTCALLKGRLALPTLISSMVVAKIVEETNDYERDDGATFNGYVSLIVSAIASLNGWLLREVRTRSGEKEGATLIFLHTFLLLGSRGMELVGGFILAFSQLMRL
jgi:hypothetical protein